MVLGVPHGPLAEGSGGPQTDISELVERLLEEGPHGSLAECAGEPQPEISELVDRLLEEGTLLFQVSSEDVVGRLEDDGVDAQLEVSHPESAFEDGSRGEGGSRGGAPHDSDERRPLPTTLPPRIPPRERS